MSSTTLAWWRKLVDRPLGRAVFSAAMCVRVPYFRTVWPRVAVLEPGRCEVSAPMWWGVRNHIGTFHAIAACNLAEVAMGLVAEATVPDTHRWIPRGMQAWYPAKSRGGLRAVATLDPVPDFAAFEGGREVVVPVRLRDRTGTEVVRADITIWVTTRSGKD